VDNSGFGGNVELKGQLASGDVRGFELVDERDGLFVGSTIHGGLVEEDIGRVLNKSEKYVKSTK
jgi:hypothetical protein